MTAYRVARDRAKAQGAQVTPFSQLESLCDAFVAIWLRKREQGREFFKTALFEWFEKPNGEFHGSYHPSEKGEEKTKKVMKIDEKLSARDLVIRANSQICEYVCTRTYPGSKRPVKELYRKPRKVTLKLGQLQGALAEFCRETRRFGALVSVVGESGPHAVGLYFNCEPDHYFYFDPNVGEVWFQNLEKLSDWLIANWEQTFLYSPIFQIDFFIPKSGGSD